MNDIGCISTDCQEITIPEVFFFYVPNTFTPDGDGVNDVFKTSVQGVSGDEVYEYTFTVFNKWGEIVFKSHDPSDAWVGDKQGAEGYFIPDGVYFWQARIRFITTEAPKLYEGHLLILR
jgi:gliding motility-associated-like protein